MSQDYNVLHPTGIISQDREKINKNFEAVASNFAGTAFPTSNLYAGMMCYRSDLKKLYYLNNDKSSWILVMDFSSGSATVANAVNATKAGELTSVLPIANGGTGAATAPAALSNLGGVPTSEVANSANKIPRYNSSGHLVLPDGSEFWIA